MRLLRLQVADFGAIERAEVELGPGLNVLHGPNDLGKSTLAAALRAVLLLPHASSAAARFAPWGSGRIPSVTLSFAAEGRVWRVTKTWSRGSGGSSLLEYSNDGASFAPEEKGRGVDGKLRDLLGWGIAGPGGKGGKHGLPSSFLATVLLAEQSSPYAVLDESLLEDGTDSARQRLTEAMAALAQHPVFKAVLDKTQKKVDEAFTATGKRKRTKGSPFTRHAERIAQRQAEYEQLRARVAEADAVSSRLAELDERRDRLMTRSVEAREHVAGLERDLARARAWAEAEAAVSAVRARHDALHTQVARVEEGRREQAELETSLPEATETVERASRARREAEAALHVAQTTLASAEAGRTASEEQRTLERRRLELTTAQQHARALHERAAEAVTLETTLAEQERAATRKTVELADLEREQARVEAERAALRAEQSRIEAGLVLRRLERAEQAQAERQAARAQAGEQRARAKALEDEAATLAAQDAGTLPDRSMLERLEALWDTARMAEAALGGGLSLEVDLREDVSLGATIDGQSWPEPVRWRTFEAKGSAELRFGKVATVRVVGGDVERRREAEQARRLFLDAAQPVLAAAGVPDLAALRERVAQADARRQQAERLRQEASASLRLAEAADASDETLHSAEQSVRALELELEATQLERPVVSAFADGADEAALRRRESEALARAAGLMDDRERVASAMAELRAQLEVATARRSELDARLDAVRSELGDAPAQAKQRAGAELERLERALQELDGQLETLARSERERVSEARATLEQAEAATEAARAAEEAARARLSTLHERLSAVKATVELHARTLDEIDQEALRAELTDAQAKLQTLQPPEQPVDLDTIEDARTRLAEHERLLEEVSNEVRKTEGALQQVGGEVVRERADSAREALDAARRQAAELELDYDAWQLLAETLREAENDEGRNLGQVLGSAVAERFYALTAGRYGEVALSPDLKTEGLQAAGDLRSVHALSEGLKEQLATLLRISIAEQLSCALVLDDHLTQTDPARLGWFSELLRTAAASVQVCVLTCRPADYLRFEDMPSVGEGVRDTPDGRVRAIDLTTAIRRV